MFGFKEIDGDIVVSGDLEYINDDEDLIQSLKAILSTRLTEFFLDTELGLDLKVITDKTANEQEIELVLVEALHQDERVEEVRNVSIDLNRETRQATISGDVLALGKMIDLADLGVLYG